MSSFTTYLSGASDAPVERDILREGLIALVVTVQADLDVVIHEASRRDGEGRL